MSQTVILTPVRPFVYSKHYSEREYQRWAKRHQRVFARRKGHAMNRRRDSKEEISVLEYHRSACPTALRNALIHFNTDSTSSCYNRLDLDVAQRMKARVNHEPHHCSFAGNCTGTVKLAWYQRDSSVGTDGIFHVVGGRDYDAEIFVPLTRTSSYGSNSSFSALSTSPGSTVASSPDSVEYGFPTFFKKESSEEKRKRKAGEEQARAATEQGKARNTERIKADQEKRRAEYAAATAARGQSGLSPTAHRHASAITAGYGAGHRHS